MGNRVGHGEMMVLRGVIAVAVLGVAATFVGRSAALTTVTEYTYNDDGALGAVTESIGGRDPETVYLTWDNFVPNESNPALGTVMPGNGTLRAIGVAPGGGRGDRGVFLRSSRPPSFVRGAGW